MASLTCLHIRDTRSHLEVRLPLECTWPAACSEELCQSPNFLVGTCLLTPRSTQPTPHNQPSPWRDWRQRSGPDIVPDTDPRAVLIWTERDDMLCPWPNIVLNQLTAQPYVDVVHSTSHGSSLIYEFTDNTLHSSVQERLDKFPQTAPLLVSCATLQLRGWIPPVPPALATCYPSARPRHPVEYRSRAVTAVQAQGSTNGTTSRFDLGLSWLEAQELKTPRCARCLGAQHQRLQISVWVSIPPRAWRPGGTVCACVLHPIHIVASRLVACLSAVQALCKLTDQVLELPLCQHRGAPLHLSL